MWVENLQKEVIVSKEQVDNAKLDIDWVKAQIETQLQAKALKDEILNDTDRKLTHEQIVSALSQYENQPWPDVINKNTAAYVISLQLALKAVWQNPGKIDALYGEKTKEAVKAFQRSQGLDDDGAAGPYTIAKLIAVLGWDAKQITVASQIPLAASTGNSQASAVEAKPVLSDFYANNTNYKEQNIGGKINKVYTLKNYKDVPTVILPNTVMQLWQYVLYSNGKVYENTNGAIKYVGTRDQLEIAGKFDSVWKKEFVQPVTQEQVEKNPQKYHLHLDEAQRNWVPDVWYTWASDNDANNFAVKQIVKPQSHGKWTTPVAPKYGKWESESTIDVQGAKSYEKILNKYLGKLWWLLKKYGYLNDNSMLKATLTSNKKDMQIVIWTAVWRWYSELVLGKISPSTYVWENDSINTDAVTQNVEKLLLKRKALGEVLSSMSGKKFTSEYLFGTPLEKQPVYIQTFFQKVSSWGKNYIEIESSPKYTSIDKNNNIVFAFDFDWVGDPDWVENQVLKTDTIIANNTFNKEVFRKALAAKVAQVAKEHQNDDY